MIDITTTPEIKPINTTKDSPAGDFYVSYNPSSRDYGSDTTALVLGDMDKFYILIGDHRKQYDAILSKGWDACLDYYKANMAEFGHKFSDKL